MFVATGSVGRRRACRLSLVSAIALTSALVHAQAIVGAIGSSSQWGSGWMDIAPAIDLKKGETLRIRIGGSAEKVLVRLLPRGVSPESDAGIAGGPIVVPRTRVIDVSLQQEHKQIVQISVHGGPNPWGKFPLGGGNGPASVVSVERIK